MRRASGSPNRRQSGFSLIELLIAIVVLLVGVVAVAKLVPAAIQTNTRNRYDSTALILAQRQLERIVTQDIRSGTPAAGPNNHYFFCSPAPGDLNFVASQVTIVNPCPAPFSTAGSFFVYRLGLSNAAILDTTPRTAGANLAAGSLDIDWGQAYATVPDGYKNRFTLSETALVGTKAQALGGLQYETRWNVLTIYANFNGFVRPVAKRVIISVRGGPPGAVARPATISTWVAWRDD